MIYNVPKIRKIISRHPKMTARMLYNLEPAQSYGDYLKLCKTNNLRAMSTVIEVFSHYEVSIP